MTVINAKDGTIASSSGQTPDGADAYSAFASNLTQMLQDAQKVGNQGTANLEGQIGGLQRGQAALGAVSPNNPLAFLYNMAPNSAKASDYGTMGSIFEPGISSIQGQEKLAQENLQGFKDVLAGEQTLAQTKITAYNAAKPVWTLSPTPNAEGQFYYYNTNTPPGQAPQTYAAGQIPPGVGGSAGGSPQSGTHTTLSASNNPYGIKMTATTTKLFADAGLSPTPGPEAVDGGNFWSFPDAASGEKATRTLLTSNIYANDSVDQALRHWSNYTGTGKYPGYNSSILAGTGIDPNALIKTMTPAQIDVIMAKMKLAENVGGSANTTRTATSVPLNTSVIGKIAHNVAFGVGGMSYSDGVSQISNAFGNAGGNMVPQLLPLIMAENPNFSIPKSNAAAVVTGENATKAGALKPLITAADSVMDGTPSIGGQPATEGLLAKFDKLDSVQQQGGNYITDLMNSLSGGTGLGKTALDDYKRSLIDAKAKINAVLSVGASLGVVKSGETADSLLPDNMSRAGLIRAIATIKGLEQATYNALAGTSTSGGTAGVTTSGLKYTIN